MNPIERDSRDRTGRTAALRLFLAITAAVSFLAVVASGVCMGLYRGDQWRLRTVAAAVIQDTSGNAERVQRLTQWVYANHGFRRNPEFFLFPRMRATSVQVLERGGDCADKSRLLAAMLRQMNIPATMLMCFDPSGAPAHTVVEAVVASGEYMISDPVFNMVFPRPGGGYFGLLELRSDAEILRRRIAEVRALRPSPHDPIQAYHEDTAIYANAMTMNWNKNAAARTVFALLHGAFGNRVYRLSRPAILEEPHLAAIMLLVAIAAAGAAMHVLCARLIAGTARRVQPLPPSPLSPIDPLGTLA